MGKTKKYTLRQHFVTLHITLSSVRALKVVSATFLLVSFLRLKESTCKTMKNVFCLTSKALFVLEIIKF